MNANLEELLALYAMGLLEEEEEARIAVELETNADAVRQLDELVESFQAFSHEASETIAPPDILGGILKATQSVGRFDDLLLKFAALVDHTVDKARELLASVDDAGAWEAGPSPESAIIHFEGGPRLAGILAGFVRLEAGACFPEHRHLGKEIVFVLQGAFVDSDGTVVRRGESRQMLEDTTHGFTALRGPALIYLVVLEAGVEFDVPFEV